MNDLHAAGLLAAHDKSSDQCVTEHRQVRPVHVGKNIGTEYRLPHSAANSQVHDGGAALAFHHQPILALEGRNANGACAFDHGRGHRVRVWRGLNKNRSSRPAISWFRRAMPIFNAAIDVQYRFVTPSGVPSLGREEIPVILVPARPAHAVDAPFRSIWATCLAEDPASTSCAEGAGTRMTGISSRPRLGTPLGVTNRY